MNMVKVIWNYICYLLSFPDLKSLQIMSQNFNPQIFKQTTGYFIKIEHLNEDLCVQKVSFCVVMPSL